MINNDNFLIYVRIIQNLEEYKCLFSRSLTLQENISLFLTAIDITLEDIHVFECETFIELDINQLCKRDKYYDGISIVIC